MENKNVTHQTPERKEAQANCNVSMTFNFTVGTIAIVAAGVIGYLVYYCMER